MSSTTVLTLRAASYSMLPMLLFAPMILGVHCDTSWVLSSHKSVYRTVDGKMHTRSSFRLRSRFRMA